MLARHQKTNQNDYRKDLPPTSQSQFFSTGSIFTRTIFVGCVTEACPVSTSLAATESMLPEDRFKVALLTGVSTMLVSLHESPPYRSS